jgi:asparagine synthase (glutamine-hydrolysing)
MELRIPYLDIDVVNFAFSIPSKYKINGFFDKVPLRQALKSKLPEEIRLRSKKALNMPYQKWFKTKRWQTLLHDTLAKSSIESLGIFNYDGIYNMLTNHQSGKQNNAHALWALLNLILWLQKNKT